ncbi:MAG: hypothetical protein A3H02_02515 [Candidatus Niyogibacteria bacterium RIFCSPLOWO2_12_FULL_41_13]|uniref:acylphosphatase n=1 Tax=Candidatus Niyogibacteria bacterium RIFCSPLOWO2_12_FULL_41_13 TaxID=1801726 RepID=A0A1G2F0U7_9BACT|nr:MAG: hypothetical protein A3H02_02515 [Candidatus Niyogibacteria bacterium RIFCSPLOWO2_12_FULL_41_13]
MIAKKIRVFGRVQGIFFRHSSKIKANELGIRGYAQNREDGSVEIFVQGEDEAIENFVAWARKGPDSAEVKDIKIETIESEKKFNDFYIL